MSGMHLVAPGTNMNSHRGDDQADLQTTFTRSMDLNFPLPSRRHSSSEDSSRITNNISKYGGIKSRSSIQSRKDLYNTAEPHQRSLDGELSSHRQNQLLKTAEKNVEVRN